ncbi:MAG: DUF2807 domain-containing protein [Parvularculaceae bacterium]
MKIAQNHSVNAISEMKRTSTMMKFRFLAIIVLLCAPNAPYGARAAEFSAEKVTVSNVRAHLVIHTGSYDQVTVTIQQGKAYHRLRIEEVGGVLRITGDFQGVETQGHCCSGIIRRDFRSANTKSAGDGREVAATPASDFPVISITAPLSVDLEVFNSHLEVDADAIEGRLLLEACAIYGEFGALDQAVINLLPGSRLVIGDVKSLLELDMSGDASLVGGNVSMMDADIAGSGDVTVSSVTGMADISIAGSGRVRMAHITGPLTARIAGSGVVSAQSGTADPLKVLIDGSGGVYVQGQAQSPDLRLSESAEVRIGSVAGQLRRHGTGVVIVGGEELPN